MQGTTFWKPYLDLVPPLAINSTELLATWTNASEQLLAAVRAKLAAPLEQFQLTTEITAALTAYEAKVAEVAALNEQIQQTNKIIAKVKAEAAKANPLAIEATLKQLYAQQHRYTPTIAALCCEYLAEKKAKKATEAKRDAAKTALDQYRATIILQYETAINEYLARFNTGFRLKNLSAANQRAGSTCSYHVLINNHQVPLTATSGPSFRNMPIPTKPITIPI